MRMIVKIISQIKTDPAKDEEFKQLLQEMQTIVTQAEGFISGEIMQSIEDPSVHLGIGTWRNIKDWNNWLDNPERKAIQDRFSHILMEPVKMSFYQYKYSVNVV
jgi:quinol monooxygenase YgiN